MCTSTQSMNCVGCQTGKYLLLCHDVWTEYSQRSVCHGRGPNTFPPAQPDSVEKYLF